MLARIAIGFAFFATLAIHDVIKNGRRATRWREYVFLLSAIALAMLYGLANDLITSRISWEYFFYGKGLYETLSPRVPPEPAALAWAAAKIGMKATWTAGAIAGVALLIANNPRLNRARLSYRRLLSLLIQIVLVVIPFAIGLGLVGYAGGLNRVSEDFRAMARDNMFRPQRFLCVFGIHSGAYLGGAIGIVWAVWRVLFERQVLKTFDASNTQAPEAGA